MKFERKEDPPHIPKSFLVQWNKIVNGHSGHTVTKLRPSTKGRVRTITVHAAAENLDVRARCR